MYLQKIVLPSSPSQLPHRLDEWSTLDIPYRSTKLDDANIRLFVRIIHRYPRHSLNPILNRVGKMGHHLHSTTKVVALPLALDNVLVDLARGDVVFSSQGDVKVPLVVAQVKVDFSAIVEDKHFPMPVHLSAFIILALVFPVPWLYILRGRHGSGVDIHVWVDLDRRNVRCLSAFMLPCHALLHALS